MCSLHRNVPLSNAAAAAERANAVSHSLAGGMGRMATLQAAAILNVQQPAMARRSVRPISGRSESDIRILGTSTAAIGRTGVVDAATE